MPTDPLRSNQQRREPSFGGTRFGRWSAAAALGVAFLVSATQAQEPGPARTEAAVAAKEVAVSEPGGPSSANAQDSTDDRGGSHDQEGDASGDSGHGKHSSRLTDERIPLQIDDFPQRPKPILELGEPFLGTGTLRKGITLPTGAVWQPQFVVFGTHRIASQLFDDNDVQNLEVATRLDLFGNLQLSGSERLVIGLRPLDQRGRFTSWTIESDRFDREEGVQDELNSRLFSLFFEGDFGELFPNLSRDDFSATDWGFSVGRQPLIFQEGFLINDVVDGIGITRNTLLPKGTSNFRATLFFGWNNLDRADRSAGRTNREDDEALLWALFTSTDVRRSTIDLDLAYLSSDLEGGEQFNLGISAVQRIGKLSTSFFAARSEAPDGESDLAADGSLLFGEVSWIPHGTKNHPYVSAYVALDDYAPVVRDPALAGPLGRVGITFAAVGLGTYGAPLSNQAREVAGGAFGYQFFFDKTRRQLIAEVGLRVGLASDVADEVAGTVRYQRAFGQHFVFVADAFVGLRESLLPGIEDQSLWGGRLEWLTKF